MRKVFCFFILVGVFNTFLHSQTDSVKIGYTGNMGVSITTGGDQVVIDALHKGNEWGYLIPDEKIRDQILSKESPYGKIKISLATHWHTDHFNEEFADEFLQRNLSAKKIGTQQIYEKISDVSDNFEKIKKRIFITDNSPKGKKIFDVDNIKVKAYNIPHYGARHSDVQNSGYLVEINGLRIFHAGDGDPGLEYYSQYNLDKEKIDIAIFPTWFISRGGPVINYLKPSKVIITHINPRGADELKTVTAIKRPDLILFTELEQEITYNK